MINSTSRYPRDLRGRPKRAMPFWLKETIAAISLVIIIWAIVWGFPLVMQGMAR
jgi:hypothetical protein